jgi:hypothetical protein
MPWPCSSLARILGLIGYLCLAACETKAPSRIAPSTGTDPLINPLDAVVASPRETILIKGKNLSSAISLFVNDKPQELIIVDAENARLVLPEVEDPDFFHLNFRHSEQSLDTFSLAKSAAVDKLPIASIDLQFICDSVVLKDLGGTAVRGKARCGVTPTKACSSDGEVDCIANDNYKAAATAGASQKILSGKSLAGINGAAPLKLIACTSDGQGNCTVDSPAFKAAKLSNFSSSDIRSSARVAGVQGNLAHCSSDGEIGCLVLGPNFSAANVNGAAAKIVSGQSLAGILGAAARAPASCSVDNDINCLATPAFPAIVKADVSPGQIKAGTIIAGINGAYPSVTYPLMGSTATPDLTMFQSQMTSNGSFEFFDSAGLRHTGSGDSDLTAANIRLGTAIESLSINGTMPAVLPTPPMSLTSLFFTSPNRIALSWSVVTGAAGYILVARAGAPVTFVPTRNQVYVPGTQGPDTILYVGTDLNFLHTNILSGNSYNYAVYSYNSDRFYSASPTRTNNNSLFCQGLAGGIWVGIPGDTVYGTSDFCVQKFEAKDVGGVPTSQAALTPWVSITQTAAISACRALGSNYDLISNAEWMTIGANIAQVAGNWSSSTVGVGALNRGHTDGNPNSACAASTDDSLAWVQTDCTAKNSSGDVWNQKRTHTLASGAVIWDLAGNTWDWTNYLISNTNAKPYASTDGAPLNAWREFTTVNSNFTALARGELILTNAQKSFWNDSWSTSAYGVGQYVSGVAGGGGTIIRGATWNQASYGGLFATSLDIGPSNSYVSVGFRCVAHPPAI